MTTAQKCVKSGLLGFFNTARAGMGCYLMQCSACTLDLFLARSASISSGLRRVEAQTHCVTQALTRGVPWRQRVKATCAAPSDQCALLVSPKGLFKALWVRCGRDSALSLTIRPVCFCFCSVISYRYAFESSESECFPSVLRQQIKDNQIPLKSFQAREKIGNSFSGFSCATKKLKFVQYWCE